MIFLSAAFDSGDSFLKSVFDMLMDFFKHLVEILKDIPTGFGVSLYSFLIALLILSIVLTGVVVVVRAPVNVHMGNVRRNEKSDSAKKKE